MADIDPAIEKYESFSPKKYPILETFRFEQDLGSDNYTASLHVTLSSEDGADEKRLTLTFTDVTNFRFEPGVRPIRLWPLMIVRVDRQWEGIKYQVFNFDAQDIEFAFYAGDFMAELI